ncbi:MAG: menaquinone-specific isochorismate synthase [Clostridia bacterium]|nr:menaquinone-specific isochorismate synthase [Clostridia bacterium]
MDTSSQVKELYQQFVKGIEKLRQTSRTILISELKKVNFIDPLCFFASEKAAELRDRVYWTDPTKKFILAGVGSARIFSASNLKDRFTYIENEWKKIVKNSIIPNALLPATGPIIIGGFSFDPFKKRSNLWYQFPDAKMILPKFMLTASQDGTWLTTNIMLRLDDNIEGQLRNIVQEREQLFQQNSNLQYDSKDLKYTYREIYPEKWIQAVDKITEEIRSGILEKVVLARELRIYANKVIDPALVLNRLREEQPMSYIFAIESEGDCFLGASPERLVKRKGSQLLSSCLAGSIARGKTYEEDEKLGLELLHNEKNLHEHKIVVKMVKSGMSKVCETVSASQSPTLYKLRDIQHLYTPIIGKAREGISLLSVVKHLHPTPALGGFPRKTAIQKIREMESLDRGWYAGPIGWIDYKGDGEFAVAIRSGLLKGAEASLFAGCGIVGDSDSVTEYKETQIKFKPMISALGGTWNDNK